MQDIVSVGEAARILEKSEATVRNWTEAGILSAFRLAGTGQRLYRRGDVERVAQERRRQ
jgi:excisionase family DNA binding protein